MGSEWPTVTLGDEVDLLTGFPFKSSEYTDDSSGIKLVRGDNVVQGHLRWEGVKRWPTALSKGLENYELVTGDVVLAMDRPWIEAGLKYSEICNHDLPSLLVQRVSRLRGKKRLHTRFLKYLIGSPHFTGHVLAIQTGTAVPHISAGQIKESTFKLPPLPEQKAIAHILGSLDDKIELNRKMKATLEAMAQALFKSWFVDFDPVIDNALAAGNPIPEALADRAEIRRQALANGTANRDAAKPFPAAFQQTESMGCIPEGWEVKTFDVLAKLDTTSVKPFEHPDTLWEHYSIPSFDSTGMPSWDRGDEIKSNKYLVKPGAILSSKLNPKTERTWSPFMIDEKTSICSTEFMQFVPHNKDEQAFVYSLIRSDPFQANILERVTGSTGSRQRAQPKQIAEIEVIDCSELLRAEFIKIALPLSQSIRSNSLQVQILTKLRDTLLPKLISGEVRRDKNQDSAERLMP